MTTTILIIAACNLSLWLVANHYRREMRRARFELRASVKAGEMLCADLDSLKTALAALERSNYAMACELYGQAAIDRAIRDARERGVN